MERRPLVRIDGETKQLPVGDTVGVPEAPSDGKTYGRKDGDWSEVTSVGTLTAGSGLTGGGNMTSNQTVALGTPSSITSATSNSATGTTHTHALDATGVTAGSYGGASSIATFSVDAKGRITSAASVAVSVPAGNITGTLPIANGGTGATTASTARANLGLGNVDNTSDLAKPISTATQTALNAKQDSLGFPPVQQGGGTGQFGNKIYLGWSSVGLCVQVDSTDLGAIALINSAPTFTGTVTAPAFSGALYGNASTATNLATARTIWTIS